MERVANHRAQSVLVVDDDPAIRVVLRQMLEYGGFRVAEAGDGQEAGALLAGQPFDLVLVDLIMPEQEGLETITGFRRNYPALKIIAISGAFGGGFLEMARYLGADLALPKPIGRAGLLAAIRELLEEGGGG
jgi:CheY-like chemotaxis protein